MMTSADLNTHSPDVKAWQVRQENNAITGHLTKLKLDQLSPGDVTIHIHYSSLNYKDALAISGQGKIMRRLPLVAGIDLAGVVASSDDSRFQCGQPVLVNGCGLGEIHDGGLAEMTRVPGDWVIPLPAGLSEFEAMALGTAGLTAALCVHRLETNGQSPAMGPIAITGASGGVGSIAVTLLTQLGYEVIAISARPEIHPYLESLGAAKTVTEEHLSLNDKPLQSTRFGGVIDTVGGNLLAQLLASTQSWGNVVSVGMAASPMLDTSVFPFILRGVNLLGVSSSHCPMPLRLSLWQRLGQDLKPGHLATIVARTIDLPTVGTVCKSLLSRQLHGRTVVDCRR